MKQNNLEIKTISRQELETLIIDICIPLVEEYYQEELDNTSEEDLKNFLNFLILEGSKEYKFNVEKDNFSMEEYDFIKKSFEQFVKKLLLKTQENNLFKNNFRETTGIKPTHIEKLTNIEFLLSHPNEHYILTDQSNNKYHVKSALNKTYLKDSKLNEIFMYKILEHLGYGPVSYAMFIKEKRQVYTITEDLNNKKEQKSDKKYNFKTFKEMISINDPLLESNTRYENHKFMLDLLVDLLELADVKSNESNYGIRTSKPESSIDIEDSKSKPMIVDFHLLLRSNKEEKSKSVEEIVDIYYPKTNSTMGFAKSINSQSVFATAIERLASGKEKTKKAALEDAFIKSLQYAREIQHKIINATQESDFDIEEDYSMRPVEQLKQHYMQRWTGLNSVLQSQYIGHVK
jgi:hypothetical protein